jgi:dihydroflavonol-4-reductase
MKVLVTGANGFLAGHIIHELLNEGYSVRAMMRASAKAPALKGLKIDFCFGNITDMGDVTTAVRECDVVIHTAATTSQSLRRLGDYYEVNVKATVNLIDAISRSSCRKMIFVSTANTIGYGTMTKPGSELTPPSPLLMKSGYARSKLKAQELVLKATEESKIEAVIVNPTFLIGPMDFNPQSGRIFSMIMGKRVALCPSGGKNFVDVRHASNAIVNAIQYGKTGECYLIAGQNMTFSDFFKKVRRIANQKTCLLHIPGTLLQFFGLFGNVCRRLGLNAGLDLTNAKILCQNSFYSHYKAARDLHLRKSEIDIIIRDYIEWKEQQQG